MNPGDQRVLDTVRHSLTREFEGVFSPETVAQCLTEFMTNSPQQRVSIDFLWSWRNASQETVCKPQPKWRES